MSISDYMVQEGLPQDFNSRFQLSLILGMTGYTGNTQEEQDELMGLIEQNPDIIKRFKGQDKISEQDYQDFKSKNKNKGSVKNNKSGNKLSTAADNDSGFQDWLGKKTEDKIGGGAGAGIGMLAGGPVGAMVGGLAGMGIGSLFREGAGQRIKESWRDQFYTPEYATNDEGEVDYDNVTGYKYTGNRDMKQMDSSVFDVAQRSPIADQVVRFN